MKSAYLVTIDLTKPETHRAQIRIEARGDALPPVLQFPVWTPGSYLIREYARHITLLEPADKISKNEWRLQENPKAVTYEVYCFEKTVRTSFLDTTHAVLVGATLLPILHAPFEVQLILPRDWKSVSSALKFRKTGSSFRTLVNCDDDWIDKPIIAWAPGSGGLGRFRVNGIQHHVAWVGTPPSRPMQEITNSLAKIVKATLAMFGGAPFEEYWFLLHFAPNLGGGLEHRDSQLSQFDGPKLSEPADWNRFLKLIAHEYFHAWNVKSLRPAALGPFNYFAENYTQDIWFAEGLTDYFDDIIPLQAGLYSKIDHDKARLKDVTSFPDGHPGHFRRSLAESSFDAWIRYYRPDEDSVNTDVSYYGKGAILGWCWDMLLQRRSKGRWTLAKLMKAFYKEFGIDAYEPLAKAKPGYTRAMLFEFAEKTTGIRQKTILEDWITSRKPLPWREAARFFGVKWKENITAPSLEFLGLQTKWDGKGTITAVLSGGSGEQSGVSVGDEILALNNVRVTDADKFKLTLKNLMANRNKDLELLLSRGDRILIRKIRCKRHHSSGVEILPL